MMLTVRRPVPILAPYVELFWHDMSYASSSHAERILPAGSFTLTIELRSGIGRLHGIRSTYIEIDTEPVQTVIGVLFRAGGWRAFVTASGEEFYNQSVPLAAVFGSSGNKLCDRLREERLPETRLEVLEHMLCGRMRPHAALHPAVRHGVGEFQHAPHIRRVLDVVNEVGLSRRRFSELFREQIGLTPKLYCRLLRFRRVVHAINTGLPVDWAKVAVAGGYSDQAHLVHEFREFSGLSPNAFLGAERSSSEHVRLQ